MRNRRRLASPDESPAGNGPGIQRAAWVGVPLLCLPVLAHSQPTLVYESMLIGNPPLERPVSATLQPGTNELCVTDAAAVTLDVFDESGHHRFRTDAMSALRSPNSGCIDSEGDFVFTDTDTTRQARTIRCLNFLGEPRAYDPEIPRDNWAPRHLIITQDGHYVSLDRSALLAKHDASSGALLWKWQLIDPESERAGLLGRPAEAPDGSIYIPSGRDAMVFLVTPEGQPNKSFGYRGSRPGELSFPVAVTFAPDGLVLVLDRMKHKVIVFDRDHEFLAEFGRVGFRPGMFYSPVAIAAAPDGRVYIAQGFEGRVQVFRLTNDVPR